METPDPFDPDPEEPPQRTPRRAPPSAKQVPPGPIPRPGHEIWGIGEQMGWIAGLVLALSSFMSWYSGSSIEGPTLSVIGWNSGTLGKLVFFVGLAVVLLAVLREIGVELPPVVPESLVVLALGTLGTIFVLIRLISVPETFAGTSGRGIGIWIALIAGLAVIASGLLRAGEEL